MSTFLSINPSLNFSHSLVKESEPEFCFLLFFFKRFNQSGSAPDKLFLLFSFSHLSRLWVRLFRLQHKSRLLSTFPILVSNTPFLKDHPTLLPFISFVFPLPLQIAPLVAIAAVQIRLLHVFSSISLSSNASSSYLSSAPLPISTQSPVTQTGCQALPTSALAPLLLFPTPFDHFHFHPTFAQIP